jgi:hypothetical protein
MARLEPAIKREYEKLEALGYTKIVLWALQQEELYF